MTYYTTTKIYNIFLLLLLLLWLYFIKKETFNLDKKYYIKVFIQ